MAATKIDYSIPLTAEQAAFAERNHNLIYSFLHKYKLPPDDFYDIAALGLIRAVQAYSQSDELRQYKFSTLAYTQMRSMSSNERRSRRRHAALSLDAAMQTGNPIGELFTDPGAAKEIKRILDRAELENLLTGFTPEEKSLLSMNTEGIKQGVIAETIGRHQVYVSRQLKRIKHTARKRHAEIGAAALSIKEE
jgi:RNA polymerase sigma-70 factor (ECF subfamily)